MGRSRNLSQLKPNVQGLIETDDIAANAVTPSKMANAGQELGMRNRIINGDMRIHQRGGAVTTGGGFPVDRFVALRSGGAATFTAQQSTVVPAGFTHSLLYQVGTGASPGSSDFSGLIQLIEGLNVADLAWGTASAQPITVSFKVRSSVTGTFAFAIRNGASNRSYVASFTINSANTFEDKAVVIPGDTSGTWATDNSIGLSLIFDLGVGASLSTTAGSWQAGNFIGLTGGTKLISTSSATFYVTGVQIEAGSTATPFERRQYGQEVMLCQRYYETGAFGFNGSYQAGGSGCFFYTPFKVTKRTTPSISTSSVTSANLTSPAVSPANADTFTCGGVATVTGVVVYYGAFAASAEL